MDLWASCAKTPPTSNHGNSPGSNAPGQLADWESGRSTSSLNCGSGLGRLTAMDPLPPPLAFLCLVFSGVKGKVNRDHPAATRD